jgi:hypothetical protein
MSVTRLRRKTMNVGAATGGGGGGQANAAATTESTTANGSEASYAIVMMPLIKESHYQCVMKQTVVPQVTS